MSKYRTGCFVGSLSTSFINRLLAKALVRLAPAELDMTEIALGDLIGGVQYVAVAGGMKKTVTQQTDSGPAGVAILAVAKQ